MTEKGTPSETFRIEHLPSGLAMLCRPNGSCRPATKEELFFDSENSRLRDELAETKGKLEVEGYNFEHVAKNYAEVKAALAEAKKATLDSVARFLPDGHVTWREVLAGYDAANSADHTCHWHDHFVAEAAKCLAAERELEKERQEHADTRRVGLAAYKMETERADRADTAVQQIGIRLGTSDEWASQESMIADVTDRAESLARELEKKTAALLSTSTAIDNIHDTLTDPAFGFSDANEIAEHINRAQKAAREALS